jgi:rhodanese-related sulfurtransferase
VKGTSKIQNIMVVSSMKLTNCNLQYNKFSLFLLLILNILSSGKSQSILTISPKDLKEKLDANKNIILIDVRSSEEFDGELGHIPGAILRPLTEINKWYEEFLKQKDQEIVMVCRSGNRSSRSTEFLQEQGFTYVMNLTGGMLEWNKLGYPVEKKSSSETPNAPQ